MHLRISDETTIGESQCSSFSSSVTHKLSKEVKENSESECSNFLISISYIDRPVNINSYNAASQLCLPYLVSETCSCNSRFLSIEPNFELGPSGVKAEALKAG